MALFVVGKVFQNAPATELALPEGTQTDDLVIIGVLAGFSTVNSEGVESGPIPSARVTDVRFPLLAGAADGSIESETGEPARKFSVWVGTAGDPDIPVSMLVEQGADAFGSMATVELIVLRDDSGAPVELDGRLSHASRAAGDLPAIPGERTPPPELLPGLSADDDAGEVAILALGSWATALGGLGGVVDVGSGLVTRFTITRSESVWTPLAAFFGEGSYLGVDFFAVDLADPPWTDEAGVPVGAVPEWFSPAMVQDVGWFGAAIGIRAATAATRQFPRDDGLGLSSATRVYPAPKSQRVVGGHL